MNKNSKILCLNNGGTWWLNIFFNKKVQFKISIDLFSLTCEAFQTHVCY